MSNDSCTITQTEGDFHVHMKEPRWIIDNKGRCVGSTADCGRDDYSTEERTANARLMASAPALLRSCKEALRVAENWIHNELDGTSMVDEELVKLQPIRDAIERAEAQTIHSTEAYKDIQGDE